MKRHLKSSDDYPALIEAVASIVDGFPLGRQPDHSETKERIQTLQSALKHLTPFAQKLLSSIDDAGRLWKDEFYYAPLVQKQCAVAIKHLDDLEELHEKRFFDCLAVTYNRFTDKPVTYNHTTVFAKFCSEAYWLTGFIGELENVRDKVRKYIPQVVFYETPSGETVAIDIKNYPKRPKTKGKNKV